MIKEQHYQKILPTSYKIKTLADLLKEISQIRKENSNSVIVLANGCFDYLHVGHLRYLEGAAKLGDFLIVAVNSDEQVRVLKGAGRPLSPALERAEIIAALHGVDFVTIFSENTVANLLLTLKPEIHAKGTDYTPETVPEFEIVKSYGGKTIITGDAKDHSSTELISKLKDKEANA